MKAWIRFAVSPSYWRYRFSAKRTVTALLSAFGAMFLLVQMVSYFSGRGSVWIQSRWYLFLVAGLVWALWDNRPRRSVIHRMVGRDVTIAIQVGDMFDLPGSYVVGSNTTFDTEIATDLISERSVQGSFTKRFYPDVRHLDVDIERALDGVPFEELPERTRGKTRSYPIGTVACVHVNGRTAYLLAITRLNEYGVAHTTFPELKDALAQLWEFISTHGGIEPVVTPILGSAFGRLKVPREELVREIVNSFAAACAEKQFAECLTIAIPAKDLYAHEMNLVELSNYVRHVCKYTQYKGPGDVGTGIGLTTGGAVSE